jgi:GDP-L-fucose synthase
MKIFVAGHKGLIGSALVRRLLINNINEEDIIIKSHKELDLSNQLDVDYFFKNTKIDQVYLAAAKVGGIISNNTYPAEFIYKNLMIQTNVINSAYENNVKKLIFLGSTCILPKFAKNPIKEKALLSGHLEATNEPYAIAKIAGIKMCESYNRQYGTDYRSVLPCNLYGPNDNYDAENGHLVAGIIQKIYKAKINNDKNLVVWGTGIPRREFMYVDDMADAIIKVMNTDKNIWDSITHPMQNFINISPGYDITISEFVNKACKILGYDGEIVYDTTRPDGTKNKLTDNSKIIKLGWAPKVTLEEGLEKAYDWFLNNVAHT